jgi:serine protease Do
MNRQVAMTSNHLPSLTSGMRLLAVAVFSLPLAWCVGESAYSQDRASETTKAIDDEAFEAMVTLRLSRDAVAGRCLSPLKIAEQSERRKTSLKLPTAEAKKLSPSEIHERGMSSVLLVGGVARAPGTVRVRWNMEVSGTAWVAAEGGIAVTNWHIFDGDEHLAFGAANSRGEVFPLAEVLACDPDLDIAWVRFANPDGSAPSLPPLPIGGDEPVGSWLGVVSHPGGRYFTLSQGHVTRYSAEVLDGLRQRWLETSADFAVGSSGGPAFNDRGAVIGMATMTSAITGDGKPRDFPQQMVIKSCIPAQAILSLIDEPSALDATKE